MKKVLFLIFMMSAFAINIMAQDTISIDTPPSNYFSYGHWPKEDDVIIGFTADNGPGPNGGDLARLFYTGDSITIYGIAAGIYDIYPDTYDTMLEEYTMYLFDTSYTQAFEYLRLYYPSADTIRWFEQEKIHLHTTPIAYRATIGNTEQAWRTYLDMYELYFDTAVSVADTFYAGMTFSLTDGYVYNGIHYDLKRPPLGLWVIGDEADEIEYEFLGFKYQNADGSCYTHWRRIWSFGTTHIIFPILTPNPDTTSNGDTLSAGEPDMLRRYTAVTPNPATGRAKVVSSFGLTMVEAFNAAGEKVHELRLPDAPLTATLDVSRWPTGTYILRLHTPQGVATKKLIVK